MTQERDGLAELLPPSPVKAVQLPSAEQISGLALIQAIERAALNPAVDVDKMERLMQMAERIRAQQAKEAFFTALPNLQAELPTIDEKGGIDIGKGGKVQPYAKFEDIDEAIAPVLHRHGFGLSYKIRQTEKSVTAIAVVSRGSHTEETEVTLPHDASGSKNIVQAVGSSISYAKRYATIAALKIRSRAKIDRDDDGRSAGNTEGELIDDEQFHRLRDLIDATNSEAAFLQYFKIDALGKLPASEFGQAMGILTRKQKKAEADGR